MRIPVSSASIPGEVAVNLELKEEEASLVFRVLKNRLKIPGNEVCHTKARRPKRKERLLNAVLDGFPEVDE